MRPLRDKTPEKVHLITCRARLSELLLVPTPSVVNCIGGIIAKYTETHRIQLFAVTVLSNHYHLLVQGDNISLFAENINREIAKRVNRIIGRKGSLWSRRYDDQIVIEEVDALEGLLYILTNPVKHGLVTHPKNWPGLSSYRQAIGEKEQIFTFLNYTELNKARRLAKSSNSIVHKSDYETRHTLNILPIPLFTKLSNEERIKKVEELIEKRVRKLCEERRSEGKGFLGRKAILSQPTKGCFPVESSKSNRPYCYSKNPEATKEFKINEKARRAQYTELSIKYRLGQSEIIFPASCFYPPRHHIPKYFPYVHT